MRPHKKGWVFKTHRQNIQDMSLEHPILVTHLKYPVYTIHPVVKPAWQPVVSCISCKRGLNGFPEMSVPFDMYWCILKWGRRMLQMQEVQSVERGNVYSTYRQANHMHHASPPVCHLLLLYTMTKSNNMVPPGEWRLRWKFSLLASVRRTRSLWAIIVKIWRDPQNEKYVLHYRRRRTEPLPQNLPLLPKYLVISVTQC